MRHQRTSDRTRPALLLIPTLHDYQIQVRHAFIFFHDTVLRYKHSLRCLLGYHGGKGWNGQKESDRIQRHDRDISNWARRLILVVVGHLYGPTAKFFAHISIEIRMACDLLISKYILGIAVIFINCILDLGHIRVYWKSPKMVTVLLINPEWIMNRIGYLHPKLLGLLPVFGLEFLYDCLEFLHCEGYLPCKRGFLLYSISDFVIGNLYGMWILDVF